jgi:outer membrane autotransporter protein
MAWRTISARSRAFVAALRCTSALVLAVFALPASADPPSFTGEPVQSSGTSSLVNLRGQGAIAGTAPINVQVNAVRVGGILSPLISVVRAVLDPGAQASVCIEVQNLLGLDLTFLGVEAEITAFNAEAPNGVTGRVVIQNGFGGEDVSALACADAVVLPPNANAGADQRLADGDQQPGENVTLNGSASSDPDGTIVSYQWFNASNQQIATGATPTVRLADGQHTLTLLVTDDDGATDVDTVSISITAPSSNQLPVAIAGEDRIVADTDGQTGETVALNGSLSTDPDGTIASYEWLVGQSTVIARGATAEVRLTDGPQAITLRVTDDDGGVSTDSVTITVATPAPSASPMANAGGDRLVADTDSLPGETVVLDATASSDPDGTITSYEWLLNGQTLASGATPSMRLTDGESFITLIVTDDVGNTSSDAVLITVSPAPIVPRLAELPGLTPNQLSVAQALDSVCPRLSARGAQQELTDGEAALLRRCNAITFGSTAPEQVRALDEISPQDLNATRTQALNLSRIQLANISDRLLAIRAGSKGISLVGLNLGINGEAVPIAELTKGIAAPLGGGASADESEADSLLDSRLGLWLRGNYSFGTKEATHADHGFDSDQWGLMAGADFRFSPRYVLGAAVGYGRSDVAFGARDSGGLDSRALTAALYATMYSEDTGFYVDAIANYLRSAHDSTRRIDFTEGGSPLIVDARAEADGGTIGTAVTLGYDFAIGAFTISPSVGYNYLNTQIGSFREVTGEGLDLIFDDQTYASATGNAALRITYAWKTPLGVIVPQIRGEFIREFLSGEESFGVRFANDPFDDTPRIIVRTEAPDRSYWRLATGLAAQFKHGIAGFIEYQRLESLELFSYEDVAAGLRIERAF